MIYLLRHGESKFNLAQLEPDYMSDKLKHWFRKDLVDCELTELGIQQAKEAGEKLKNVNISLVLVSPLRRTLQTAYYAFKDHPSKPLFKVIPLGREFMGLSCDFPTDIESLLKEFPFDFSELEAFKDKKLWILETFEGEDQELLGGLIKDLPEGPERLEKFTDILIETARKMHPKFVESGAHVIARGKKLKKYLHTHLKLLRETEKLVYVGHKSIFEVMTGTKHDESGYALDGITLKNGEFIEYILDEEEVTDKPL